MATPTNSTPTPSPTALNVTLSPTISTLAPTPEALPEWVDFVESPEARIIAFICTLVACIVSGYNIHKHLVYYTAPHLQKSIIRILLIVPFYALFSLFGLVWPDDMEYWELVRDIYEAIVVYSFLNLMMAYCGGENACLSEIMNNPGSISHVFPLSLCLPIKPLNSKFLRECKQATLQFVVIKPVMAFINLILLGVHPDNINQEVYGIVSLIIYNLSYSLALYYLALFYMATHEHPSLKSRHPMAKFLAVKMVVFATYYQSLIFSLVPVFKDTGDQWNSFILCCEMVLFSFLHLIAFNWSEFFTLSNSPKASSPKGRRGNGRVDLEADDQVLENAKDVMSMKDVAKDAYYNFNMSYGSHVLLDTESDTGRSPNKFGGVEMIESSNLSANSAATDDDLIDANKPKQANNIFGSIGTTIRSIRTGGGVGGGKEQDQEINENPFGSFETSETTSADMGASGGENPFMNDINDPLAIQAKPPTPPPGEKQDLDLI